MDDLFSKSIDESLNGLKTDRQKGLSSDEAKRRLQEYGENKLEGKKQKSIFQMFLGQFKDFLVIILIVAAAVSFAMGDVTEGVIIIAIVILNAVLGVTQENKANNALKALKEMSSPKAKVLRDGSLVQIPSNEVVPGDIVTLDAGDYIPADLRLIEAINLKIDESALTGESVPVEKNCDKILGKDAGLGDRVNSSYMSTIITYGRGKGVVEYTGMKTQMGKIAKMLDDTEETSTPLQAKLDAFGKLLGIVCLIVCAVIFALGLYRGMKIEDIFISAVSLAVAAIPEGLTVVVTVILAMGMQKMVKVNAIVKRLSAVETLGSTTVICSDKTGTLTQNKMTVLKLFDGKQYYDVSGTGYGSEGSVVTEGGAKAKNNSLDKMFEGVLLCNDAIYKKTEAQIIGDPTEGALLVAGEKYGFSTDLLNKQNPRLQEIPFDSARKLMSTFHNINNKVTMYTKGAPDEVLRRCSYIYENGTITPITEQQKKAISLANENYAKNALRVLGISFREMEKIESVESEAAEKDLVFVGLLSMIDPPREEVKEAINVCKNAGIGVKMITGDHKITAAAIAEQIGITPVGKAIEGREIAELTDQQLQETVKTTSVFARVSPEHKVRLVEAIKANGNIVAMTGDGVNDAPSLKKADIGIAMGITGTDVSKEAADMILTDDNFATIVHSVEEGRTIYNNIRKVVGYLLSCNIGEILLIFVAMLLGYPIPLGAIQILTINLVTDAFPAFALGMEAKEAGIMNVPPRNPKESIVNKRMMVAIIIQSCALAIGCLASFMYGYFTTGANLIDFIAHPENDTIAIAQTMCFITIVLGELLRAYSARSESVALFKMKVFGNSMLNKSVLASLAFLILVIAHPIFSSVFKTFSSVLGRSVTITEIAIAIAFAVLPIIAGEIAKTFTKRIKD